MDSLDLLRSYALAGIPLGLVTGLLLGLVARREDGWGGYGSFRRRAARLGHVAAVMLPALAGLYAALLEAAPQDVLAVRLGAGLWVSGGILLPLALFAASWKPRVVVSVVLPALALVAGAGALAFAGLSTGRRFP